MVAQIRVQVANPPIRLQGKSEAVEDGRLWTSCCRHRLLRRRPNPRPPSSSTTLTASRNLLASQDGALAHRRRRQQCPLAHHGLLVCPLDPWPLRVRLASGALPLVQQLTHADTRVPVRRPYLLPLFFALNAYATYFVTAAVPRRPSTPAEAALVPEQEAPSFADVLKEGPPTTDSAVHEQHPHVKPDPDAAPGSTPGSPAGSLSKRQKRNRKKLANDPLALASQSDSEPGSPALTRRQKLPRNRPLPKVTLSQLVNNLVFGTPTPTSRFLNWVSLGINALVFGLMMDAIFTPIFGMDEHSLAFARVGAITHDSVKLVARIPSTSSLVPAADAAVTPIIAGVVPANNSEPATDAFLPEDEFVGAKVVYRPTKPLGKWTYGPEIHTSADHDWVATVRLDGLWAATEYECASFLPSRSPSSSSLC